MRVFLSPPRFNPRTTKNTRTRNLFTGFVFKQSSFVLFPLQNASLLRYSPLKLLMVHSTDAKWAKITSKHLLHWSVHRRSSLMLVSFGVVVFLLFCADLCFFFSMSSSIIVGRLHGICVSKWSEEFNSWTALWTHFFSNLFISLIATQLFLALSFGYHPWERFYRC